MSKKEKRKRVNTPVEVAGNSGPGRRIIDALAKSRATLTVISIIAIAGFIIYSNTLHYNFVFDDFDFIAQNPAVSDMKYFTQPTLVAGMEDTGAKLHFATRYLTFLTFAINYKIGGLNTSGYHLLNIIIHILCGVLVYHFVKLTLRISQLWSATEDKQKINLTAIFAALLFICHPAQTESVTYISQRFTSLATLFYLCSITAYIKFRMDADTRKRYIYYAVSILSAVAAMITKEISFTLPAVIAVYEFIFFEGAFGRRIKYVAPLLITMLIIPAILIINVGGDARTFHDAMIMAKGKAEFTRWDYLITQFCVIMTYLRIMLLPINQTFDYDYPVYTSITDLAPLSSLLILLGIFCAGVFSLKRDMKFGRRAKIISFGIIWFFMTISVESSIIPLKDLIFEHRLYLPSVGLFMAFMNVIDAISSKFEFGKQNIIFAVISIMAVYSYMSYARNEVWRDEITLWTDVIQKSPNKARAHNNLGMAYALIGKNEDAAKEYEYSIKIDPSTARTHGNLGVIYARMGRYAEAEKEYQISLSLDPGDYFTHGNLGMYYLKIGKIQDGINELENALGKNPRESVLRANLGLAYKMMGRFEDAEREFRETLKTNPKSKIALSGLAEVGRGEK